MVCLDELCAHQQEGAVTAWELRDYIVERGVLVRPWWRPFGWSLARHLRSPAVNTVTTIEADMARACANNALVTRLSRPKRK